jgi:hypothetical protein
LNRLVIPALPAYKKALMPLERDYALLEVEPGSSHEQIRRAYLDLVKVWHPDRFPNDPRLSAKADQRLTEINLAYERLRASIGNGGGVRPTETTVSDDPERQPSASTSHTEDGVREVHVDAEPPMSTVAKINTILSACVVGAGLFTAGLLLGQHH